MGTQLNILPLAIKGSRMAVSNLTKEIVDRLCEGLSGVYHLPLQSMFGRDPEVEIAGATLLLHHSALLICNARSSLDNRYLCFVANTSFSAEVVLVVTASSNVLIGVVVGIVVIIVITLCALAIALRVCVARYRSLKDAPVLMFPRDHSSSLSHYRPSATNTLFEESDSQHEFSRDRLRLLSVLGMVPP